MSLTTKIITAMFFGILFGSVIKFLNDIGWFGPVGYLIFYDILANGVFDIIGKIFIASLRLAVVPLVFVSLICGVCSIASTSQLRSISFKTISLYLFTTAVAISLALFCALLIEPGTNLNMALPQEFSPQTAPSFKDVIVNIFPTNPVAAMAEGNMLQIIVFALLFGIALKGAGDFAEPLRHSFERLNKVILKLVTTLIQLAPYGVFSLLLTIFAMQGIGVIGNLAKYFFLLLGVLLLHGFFTYGFLLLSLAKLSPFTFFMKVRSLAVFAFSTSSSSATMPVTLETVQNKLGVNSSVCSLTVPLGATINMDGTAIMQGIATVFIAQAYNVDISLSGYLMVVLTATLASIGTAGVPGVGLIMLAMVLQQVGLPVEGIALVIGVDRLLDMTRTAVNVCGDAMVSVLVAKSENEFNELIFKDRSK